MQVTEDWKLLETEGFFLFGFIIKEEIIKKWRIRIWAEKTRTFQSISFLNIPFTWQKLLCLFYYCYLFSKNISLEILFY